MALEIRSLEYEHLPDVVALYTASPPGYSRYFTPFTFDVATIKAILERKCHDRYYALIYDGRPVGLYMLRGFDQGYATPSYGVWVAERYSGRGLARMTLDHAVTVCRGLGYKELMLKVHPENRRAKTLYEKFGFRFAGVDLKNNNLIYKLPID